ncbi:MAG: B12-binding domain-containing radical SAM protein [Phycisphaeraceae bacterium]|nr:B12-binding domain-containing radical SAM protein [Phycisphaeraceae bacterium]
MSGFRVREKEMGALGMSLPGLHDRAQAIAALPPLGLLTLAGMTPANWHVSFREAPAADEALVESIVSERPDLVAISALTASILEAYALADALRVEGIPVVLGGLHVTALPEEAIAHADAVVIGDGESTWRELLLHAQRGELRRMYSPRAPFDLREAPLPRLDLLGKRERPRYTIQTARGCPLACEFCGASRLLGPFREKPLEQIEREIEAIRALQRRPLVELADDNTFAGRRDSCALLDLFAKSGIRYFTEADWRIGERPDVLERLAESGCVQVLFGVETMELRYKGMGAKGASLARVMDAAQRIQEAGVAAIGCFVVGADGEDYESLQLLAEFLQDAPLADVQLTLQTPFPGTALSRRLRAENRLLPDRGWESYTLFDLTYKPDKLSPEALENGFRHLVRMTFDREPARHRQEIRQSVWSKRMGPSNSSRSGAAA